LDVLSEPQLLPRNRGFHEHELGCLEGPGKGPEKRAGARVAAKFQAGCSFLGHPPARDQGGSNDKESEERNEGDDEHECRGLQFFNLVWNLFCVDLEVNHFTTPILHCVSARHFDRDSRR
jgi:hypothetical protein